MKPNIVVSLVLMVVVIGFGYIIAPSSGSFGITIMSGLFQGMLLFLVAAGLSIIFGLMDVLNFAQGAYFMVGAYVSYSVHHSPDLIVSIPDPNVRFFLAVVSAVVVGALLGAFLERVLLRPLYSRPIFQIVLTFGVAIVMTEAVKWVWNTTPYSWTELFALRDQNFELFGQSIGVYRLVVIGIGFALIVIIGLLLQRTRIGIIIRAGVEDREMVEALGINVRMVFTLVFTIGCAVASFGGAIAAPFLGASIGLANLFLLSAIAVVVLGGMGSYIGTAIGSILLGLAVAVMQVFAGSPAIGMPVLASMTPMILMILVLLLRPGGLFGKGR
ncbi:MAG: branched-chain amino acid ABC transporter permease [Chloroflexi bacterium]|nr:branched-chain amino acid ABC transporter permease [Chloroflexota bacterium]